MQTSSLPTVARRLVALATTVVLAAAPALATSASADAPARAQQQEGLAVTGFALGSLRTGQLTRDAGALDTVTVAAVGLRPSGAAVDPPSDDMERVRSKAAGHGLATELLLSNYSNAKGGFDPVAAHRLLSSPDRIDAVAAQVAGLARDGGWGGVNIDLELVPRTDAGGLVELAGALDDALGTDMTLSIDVSASSSARGYRNNGYQLEALGRLVDVVVLMTYDYSGPTWSEPGPIGPVGWQEDAVEVASRFVPADQLDLGIAGYGYTWPRRGTGRSVTVAQARNLVEKDGATARWSREHAEWSARLSNGTVLWWSDARSYDARVALAERLGMHGVALWRLGSADPLG
ncbi:glycosyl hydrolase family 18 protein [Nocardioides sp. CFH 31398]|uniref:glycosyl hydrolase family 18 protein n=1 Tax=Nocardioides sp. CFH 31398 TaxID=2919579 RepID=UPI001F06BB31|nr:glycosyl hydrolase family 18 protein [Nocardioides sp. CFH 31398]MCH1866171.1 glycosyl hydrolase family 18 protein [Nocardioides sp. CFH 31398]